MKGIKISDSDAAITKGSRADRYWNAKGWDPYFKEVRPKMNLPEGLKTNDPDVVVQKFNLKAIGFGNWVKVDDRLNYLYSLIFSMYDLNKVLRFNYNIGMGLLSITFGARGQGRALAHYEPHTDIINITRYESGWISKYVRFFGTGGMGSLAHEYGHFLDYFAGAYLDPNAEIYSLTNGRSIAKGRVGAKGSIREAMDDLLEAIIWKVPEKTPSNYYKRLVNTVDSGLKGEYWLRRNEIFARAFEVYVKYELSRMNIKNQLLIQPKYTPSVYLKTSEMEKLKPKFDKVITLIRQKIK